MEELFCDRSLAGTEMQLRVRATTQPRVWEGFDACFFDTSGGYFERPPTAMHHVLMYFGNSVLTACRCEGPVVERVQSVGDIDVIPAGAGAVWSDYGPTSFLAINISPGLLRSTADAMGLNADRVELAPHLFLRDRQLEHIGSALKAELESDEPSDRLYAESLGVALASRLLGRYAPKIRARVTRGLSVRQLNLIDAHIADHLDHNVSLNALASVAGLSPSHFKALFKVSRGLPVHQYVIRRRVEAATRLLSSGRMPISQVALQTGFVDQSHLARCMRRVLGTTPAAVLRDTR